jgi:hypothetical protein
MRLVQRCVDYGTNEAGRRGPAGREFQPVYDPPPCVPVNDNPWLLASPPVDMQSLL